MATPPSDQHDIIDVLLTQHRLVKQAFAEVQAASGEERKQLFAELADLLHLHETGEQHVVHPWTRSADPQVAEDRLAEETEADAAVAELRGLAVDDPTYGKKLDALEHAVLDHAQREEQEEFPILRGIAEQQRQAMARDLQRVQAG